MKLALHLFHRDLRLEDNTALLSALKQAEQVIPAFIFDPEQIKKNSYKSEKGLRFMIESLVDLSQELQKRGGKLYTFFGKPEKIIDQLIQQYQINQVFSNRDYTPFSIQREQKIHSVCEKNTVEFLVLDDALLTTPEQVQSEQGNPYTVFAAFYRKAEQLVVQKPEKNNFQNFFDKPLAEEQDFSQFISPFLKEADISNLYPGGRKSGLQLLSKLKHQTDYQKNRDFPGLNSTTHLSPHHKFGTLSIREVYHQAKSQLKDSKSFLRELYWRDFFSHIAFHSPRVFGNSFQEKFSNIQWKNNEKNFLRWCNGTTGFPIVDAGMRELNQTGFMHNRVRMITASFLVKDLHIDWQRGEKYFATQLIDYDPAGNNGNWQWVAGTGADAAPYFRIFNPWLQQAKFDPDCVYIKKWITELAGVDAETIHNWPKLRPKESPYPAPIVDHHEAIQTTKILYQKNTRT